MVVDVNKFGKDVASFLEMAEMGGYEVIRLISDRQRSSLKVSGFETLFKPNRRSSSGYSYTPIKAKGDVKFVQDPETGFCMGFIIDTPHNRKQLTYQLSGTLFKPMAQAVKDEIVNLAKKMGVRHSVTISSNQWANRTKREKVLSKQVQDKDHEVSQKEFELQQAKDRLLELEAKLATQEKIAVQRQNSAGATVKSVGVDEDGDPIVVDTPVTVVPIEK